MQCRWARLQALTCPPTRHAQPRSPQARLCRRRTRASQTRRCTSFALTKARPRPQPRCHRRHRRHSWQRRCHRPLALRKTKTRPSAGLGAEAVSHTRRQCRRWTAQLEAGQCRGAAWAARYGALRQCAAGRAVRDRVRGWWLRVGMRKGDGGKAERWAVSGGSGGGKGGGGKAEWKHATAVTRHYLPVRMRGVKMNQQTGCVHGGEACASSQM
eukprot:366565-Chlamydomonas_euryale.AAC.5